MRRSPREILSINDYKPRTGIFCAKCKRELFVTPDMTREEFTARKKAYVDWVIKNRGKLDRDVYDALDELLVEKDENGNYRHEICP